MVADVLIRELDLVTAPEGVLRAAHSISFRSFFGYRDGDEPCTLEEWRAEGLRLEELVGLRRFVAVDPASDAVVGFAYVELATDHNTHLAWTFVAVDPARRRAGIGTAMLRHLVDLAAEDGRTSVGAGAELDTPGHRFLDSMGMSSRQTAHQNRLHLADLDVGTLHAWVARAAERGAGYSLRSWDGPTPDELVEPFAACTEVMNSAPRGDLDLEDEVMTPERLRQLEAGREPAGLDTWTLCAVEDGSGALAGFTQLHFPRWRATVGKQGDTGVDPAHRERGLGRWLKAAMLLRVLDEKPAVQKIDTWNAGSNAPMLAINDALGFRCVQVSGNWQADLQVVRERLAERSAA